MCLCVFAYMCIYIIHVISWLLLCHYHFAALQNLSHICYCTSIVLSATSSHLLWENHVVSEYRTAPIPTLSQDSSSAFKRNISIYIKINHQKSISGTILRLPKKLRLLTKNTSHMNQVSSELHHTPIWKINNLAK